MKDIAQNNMTLINNFKLGLVSLLLIIGFSCSDDVKEWKTEADQLSVTEYVYSEPELFSEFGEILQLTGIENLLRVRGPFTLMLPTNDAMQEYYTRHDVSTYNEISVEELSKMVYQHIFPGEINTNTIGLGTLPYTNGLGDYVASDFDETEIVLNKLTYIVKRDIQVANGYVHHIDYTMDPVEKSIYKVLTEQPGYSIFTAGLEKSTLNDTLDLISFLYGSDTARTRYTVLAVPDSLYNREGIHSIDDLIAEYATGDDLTDPNNGFYRYMIYHCLSGSYYFSDFPDDGIYYLINQENYLNIKVEEDFKINETDAGYTGFYYRQSNFPAKNGAIHSINSQLPYIESEPAIITTQVTDYFDFQSGDYYQNFYQRFFDGQNTFEFIKWDAEYLLYYFKPGNFVLDDDALNLDGHFWIEITTPIIRQGKYDFSTYAFWGNNRALTAWYIDGVYLGQLDCNDGAWGNETPISIGEITFEETKRHTVKMQTLRPGGFFWDYIRFTPID